jgi:type IV secretion system protein TrbG
MMATYPEDTNAKWEALKAHETKEEKGSTIPQTGEYLRDLNFNYDVDGKARWKPIRVNNNGIKTIIQMPNTMEQTEAPVLLVLRSEGACSQTRKKI